MSGLSSLILRILPLLTISAPRFNLHPGVGGAIGFGSNDFDDAPDVAGGFGVSVKPNWQLGAKLGHGIASALNGTVQSLADGHRAIDQTVIFGIANATKAALDILSNGGATLGGAVSGVIGAIGDAITELGNAPGPLDFGANAESELSVKNALVKYVGAVIDAGAHPENTPNVIAALRDMIELITYNLISGKGSAYAGPLGSISGGGGVTEQGNIAGGAIGGGGTI